MRSSTIILVVLAAGLILGGVAISGCTQKVAASPTELKIGVVASLTGPSSATGKDMWQSAQIAAGEINANGGVYVTELGQKVPVKVIVGDDESTREGGQKAVSKLISADNVDALVGGFSSAVTSASQSVVAERKVPYVITGASSPTMTRRTDIDTSYMYHFCPTTDDYGGQTTRFISNFIRPAIYNKFNVSQDRPLRLAIVYQDSPYGKGVLTAVENTIKNENLPVKIVSNESFKMGETDYRTLLTNVKSTQPDVIYSAAFLNEQAPMITQARRDVGMNTLFVVVECNDDPDYYKGLSRYGEGSIIESHFSPYTVPNGSTSNAAIAFKNSYQKKWGGLPSMMGATTYEGVNIIANAVGQAGSLDKAKIKDALAATNMPESIEAMKDGKITFSKDAREANFNLYMEQLSWNETLKELRPTIVYPADLSQGNFVLPDWYQPGTA